MVATQKPSDLTRLFDALSEVETKALETELAARKAEPKPRKPQLGEPAETAMNEQQH